MNLPNYFLADLPPEAHLTPVMIREACETLRRNRQQYLAPLPTHAIIDVVAELADSWLHPDNPFRRLALEKGAASTGFSTQTLEHGLDMFFRRLSFDGFNGLLQQDLGHAERLDRPVVTEPELKSGRTSMVTGPELMAHLTSGHIPVPALHSIVSGLLTRSAQFVKCATGADLIPRLFAHSLYGLEPKLASCLEVATWPGGTEPLESALFNEVDLVTVTGRDETLAEVARRLPPRVRLLRYGHRISFGFIARESLTRFHGREIAIRAAADVAAWDQLGCLSPHAFYVESGGSVTPELFAEMLAEALAELEASQPRAIPPVEVSAHIASRRQMYELRAAAGTETRLWSSTGSTAWTVVFESDPRFQTSCGHRFVYVKSAADLTDALHGAASVQDHVSTVALSAIGRRGEELASQLARWGVTRICPVGRMQDPPIAWRHDGRPALADLVRWTDWEQ